MSVKKAAIDSRAVEPVSKTGYPEPYRSQVMPREKRQLGDALVLRTTSGEQVISAGMCVGFPAAVEEGHQLINRGAHPAVYLEISNRDDEDTAYYTDAEVDLIASPPHARGRMTRKDGTPY